MRALLVLALLAPQTCANPPQPAPPPAPLPTTSPRLQYTPSGHYTPTECTRVRFTGERCWFIGRDSSLRLPPRTDVLRDAGATGVRA